MHDPHHGADGPDITVHGVVPDRHLQGIQPLHLELAQLIDRLDLAVLEGVLHQAVDGAPVGVAELVGDGLRFLATGYADPHTVRRLGRARLARFLHRHSRGAFGEPLAERLLAAAAATAELWAEDLAYPDLAEDIAVEARLALALTEEIHELDERIAVLVRDLDPRGVMASAPGVGSVTAAVLLGRLGDATRFHSLAAARA